jgi:hypothetical protein
VSAPTDAELEAIAASYRGWLLWDTQNAPSADAKQYLTDIENAASKLLSAFKGADQRALDALCMGGETLEGESLDLSLIPYFDVSVPPGRAVLGPIAAILNTLATAAREGRDSIPTWQTRMAQRFAALQLRDVFSKRGLKFSATVDDYGSTSPAVAALREIARRAGDEDMTIDAARKWVERAIKEKR